MNEIIKKSGQSLAGLIFVNVSKVITFIIIGRILKNDFSIFNVLYSASMMLVIFQVFGLNEIIPMYVSRKLEVKKYVTNSLYVSYCIIIISLFVFVFFGLLVVFGIIDKSHMIFSFSFAVSPLITIIIICGSIYNGFKNVIVGFVSMGGVFVVMIILIFCFEIGSLNEMIEVMSVSFFMCAFICYLIVYRFVDFKCISDEYISKLLKDSFPIFTTNIISQFFRSFPIFISALLFDKSIASMFTVCFLVSQYTSFVKSSFSPIYIPSLSSTMDKQVFKFASTRSFLFSLPLVFVLFMCPGIVNLIFDSSINNFVFRILIIGQVFDIMMGQNSLTLSVIGRKFKMYVFIVVLCLLTSLSYFLSQLGIVYLSISVSFSYVVLNVLLSYGVYRKMNVHLFTKKYKILVAIVFILLIIVTLKDVVVL